MCTALRDDTFPHLSQGQSMDMWESLIYTMREARAHQSINSAAKCHSAAALSAHNSQQWCTNTHRHGICSSTTFIGNFVLRVAPRAGKSSSLREWTLSCMCPGSKMNLEFQAPCHGLFRVVLYKWALQTEHSNLVRGNRNYEFCVYELYLCMMYLLHLFTLYLWVVIHIWTVYSEFKYEFCKPRPKSVFRNVLEFLYCKESECVSFSSTRIETCDFLAPSAAELAVFLQAWCTSSHFFSEKWIIPY